MRSSRSFFNAAVVRKDLTRFSPVWGLYSAGLCMLLMMLVMHGDSYSIAQVLPNTIPVLHFINLFYGLVCAMILFGDLYHSRNCYALHAMPLRREGWMLCHTVSGLLFSLAPNLVFSLILIPLTGAGWTVTLWWLLAASLSFLFFFGLAVCCAFCVGSRFALLVVYGLCNGLALLLGWMIETLYIPLLYGITFDFDWLLYFAPIVAMLRSDYVSVNGTGLPINPSEFSIGYSDTVQTAGAAITSVVPGDGWGYLTVCAVIGILLLGVALLLYRRRKLECAGDFIVLRPLRPAFLLLFTLSAGIVCFLFFSIFIGQSSAWLFLVMGVITGFFAGKMLLGRSLRVFGGKSWLQLALICLLLAGSLGLTKLDPLGVTRYVPAAEQVDHVELTVRNSSIVLTQEEDIAQILQLHRDAIQEPESEAPSIQVELSYTMGSGRNVFRTYPIGMDMDAATLLTQFISRPAAIFSDLLKDRSLSDEALYDYLLEHTYQVETLSKELWPGLLDAIFLDCKEGSMAQPWIFHQECDYAGTLRWTFPGDGQGARTDLELNIFSCCQHTLAYLESCGVSIQDRYLD